MNRCIFAGTVERVNEFSKGFGFTLKCDNGYLTKSGQESVCFIRCTVWSEKLFVKAHQIKPGSKVIVETKANIRKREDGDVQFYETSFSVDTMDILDTPNGQ